MFFNEFIDFGSFFVGRDFSGLKHFTLVFHLQNLCACCFLPLFLTLESFLKHLVIFLKEQMADTQALIAKDLFSH